MNDTFRCPSCNAENPNEVRFCGTCGTHMATGITSQTKDDPLIGTLVGNRFVVLEQIGQGGMGMVYRAEQTSIWRSVALKVLRPRFARDKNLLERFRNEASTASQLSHPNTITVYDFGLLEDNGLYIAMEFIEGTNLADEISANVALDWPRACRVAIQICGSLQEAHEHNIIHRDLKPENIMLTRRGFETDVVKVLDFGIAKIMAGKGKENQPALTSGNEIFGTPEYMAPEQISSAALDNRTDVYALGMIFYRMITGSLPFDAPSPIALLAAHLKEKPRPMSIPPAPPDREPFPEIPGSLERLVSSMLEKEPLDRPDSMLSVSASIKAILKEAGRTSTRAPMSRPIAISYKSKSAPKSQPPDGTARISSPEQLKSRRESSGLPYKPQKEAPKERMKKGLASTMPVSDIASEALESFKKGGPVQPETPKPPSSNQDLFGLKDVKNLFDDRTAFAPAPPEPKRPSVEEIERSNDEKRKQEEDEKEDEKKKEKRKLKKKKKGDVEAETLLKKDRTLLKLKKSMEKKRDFPAMAPYISELSTMASRNDTSARQLSNVIIKDYGLTTKLLKLVNSPYYEQYRGKVTTVSRAVVILGFEEVRQMALSLAMFERMENKDKFQTDALKDTTISSMMSGMLAKGVAKRIDGIDEEEAFVCAMLHNMGKVLVIYYLAEESHEILREMKKKKITEDSAATRVLGLNYQEIGRYMADKWDYPNLIKESMSQLPKGKLPKPGSKDAKLRDLAGFANEVTKIAGSARPIDRKTAYKRLAHRFEKSLGVKDTQLAELVSNTTEEIKDRSAVMGLNLKESKFARRALHWAGRDDLLPPLMKGKRIETIIPPRPKQDEPLADRRTEHEEVLVSGAKEVASVLESHYDMNSIILMIVETMYRGLGLSRVIFCVNDVKTGVMVGRSGLGEGVEEMLKDFRFRPRKGRDIFNQSVTGGQDMVFENTPANQLEEMLPPWYRRFATPETILLYPIMIRGFPAGLFYADVTEKFRTINKDLLVHMDRLRNHAGRAMREQRIHG